MAGRSRTTRWSYVGDPGICSLISEPSGSGGRQGDQKIAVEIKSFSGASEIDDLEKALGQFTLYHDILQEREPDRRLFLAIPREVFDDLFSEPIGQLLLKRERLRLLVFESEAEVIIQWIPS